MLRTDGGGSSGCLEVVFGRAPEVRPSSTGDFDGTRPLCPGLVWFASVATDRLEHMFDSARTHLAFHPGGPGATALVCGLTSTAVAGVAAVTASDAQGSVGHLAELADLAPDPDLVRSLDAISPEGLADDAVLELVAAWGRVASWARARQLDAVAELAARPSMNPVWPPAANVSARQRGLGIAGDEIALRLRTSRHRGEAMVRMAQAFDRHLADTGEALRHGLIDEAKARVVVDGLARVAIPVALEVQDRVLPMAPERTPGQLGGDVQRALIECDRLDAAHRHAAAVEERRVCRPRVLPDGMAGIYAVLPAADAVAVDAVLNVAARSARAAGDGRTIDQLRADTFVALLAGGVVGAGFGPVAGGVVTGGVVAGGMVAGGVVAGGASVGRGPSIRVTVPISALLGDQSVAAMLEGYGAISAADARRIAADPRSTWRRLLTDPASGRVLEFGRRSYRPPAELADLVRARDETCVMPTCGARAQYCDLDHTVPFEHGGATAPGNLGALCRHHHLLKTHAGWRLEQPEPGEFTWTTPTGRVWPPAAGPPGADPPWS